MSKHVFRARLEPDPEAAARLRDRRVLAFAGIGRPKKFFDTLRECGATIVRTQPFPDHHPYGADQIRALLTEAEAKGLDTVTTEKDFVRIAALAELGAAHTQIVKLPIRLSFQDETAVREMLSRSSGVSQPARSR